MGDEGGERRLSSPRSAVKAPEEKAALAPFVGNVLPRFSCLGPDPPSSVGSGAAVWKRAYISGLTSSVGWFVTLTKGGGWERNCLNVLNKYSSSETGVWQI